MPDSEGSRELVDLGIDTAVASGTGVADFFHPGLSVVFGPLAPALSVGLKHVLRRFARVRAHVEEAGYDFDDLVARCDGDERKAQLLIATLDAAREAGTEEQVSALARSFVLGATSDGLGVTFETAMVRTIGNLTSADLTVLRLFAEPAAPGDEVRADLPALARLSSPPRSLRESQLVAALGEASAAVVDGIVARLVSGGLLHQSIIDGGNARGEADQGWALKPFGFAVAERLKLVGESLAEDPPTM